MSEQKRIAILDREGRQQGYLYVSPALLAYFGRPPEAASRRLPVAAVAVGLDGPLTAELEAGKLAMHTAVFPPDVLSPALEFGDSRLALFMCAPQSALYRALRGLSETAGGPLIDLYSPEQDVAERLRALLERNPAPAELLAASEQILWPTGARADALDPRVEAVLQRMYQNPADDAVSIEALAGEFRMSATALTRLFRDETGVAFRRCRMWARMTQAALALADTRNLTEVAVTAGFADSAHLSRSFREMLGLSPSQVFRDWYGEEALPD